MRICCSGVVDRDVAEGRGEEEEEGEGEEDRWGRGKRVRLRSGVR